nr:MAG TPA: hypothetical protein [Caudoviricetes sp.]
MSRPLQSLCRLRPRHRRNGCCAVILVLRYRP